MKKIYSIFLLLAAVLMLNSCDDEYSFSSSYDRFETEALEATSGDESATLTWAPQTGKSNPKEYLILWTSSVASIPGGELRVPGDVTTTTIEGLVNGATYTFSVQADYPHGLSGKKTAICTPKSTRIAVTDYKAMAGDKRVFVSWKAPETNLPYTYKLDVVEGESVIKTLTPEPTATSCLVSDLTNGKEYTFVMTVVYAHGNSDISAATAVPGEVAPFSCLPNEPKIFELTKLEVNPAYYVAGVISSVTWDFGDGQSAVGESVVHCFAKSGQLDVKCEVTYVGGQKETGTLKIKVGNFAWATTASDYAKGSSITFSHDGQTFYTANSTSKGVSAYNAITGAKLWELSTASNGTVYGEGPAVGKDGTIYIGTEGKGTVKAISPAGVLKWSTSLAKACKAAPAITSNGIVYAVDDAGTLYSLKASDGSIRWKAAQSGTAGSVVVDAEGNVYMGTSAGIWSYTESGKLRWTGPTVKVTERGGSMAIYNGVLYAALKAKGGIVAVDMATGTQKWAYASSVGDCYNPVVTPDGTIVFVEKAGHVYGVKANGTLKWKTGVSSYIYTGAAVGADGCVYVNQYVSPFSVLKITADGTVSEAFNIGKQTMSPIVIGPDQRIYYGANGTIGAQSIGTHAATKGWPLHGFNLQGTNSLK